jgi:alpha-tubulin suppressor-like RCC1 family protein
VADGHPPRQVSPSGLHTCGVTPFDVLFCWGDNSRGQLGDSTTANRLTPVRVRASGLRFRQVTGGSEYTCGVTPDNRAYCWGRNDHGRLGTGTFNQPSLTPTKVKGGIRFRAVTAGLFNTCGVTPENLAYCWGWGAFLGDGTTTDRRLPVPVVGGLFFRQVDVGEQHTCGVTTGNRAYCWGQAPVPVAGE